MVIVVVGESEDNLRIEVRNQENELVKTFNFKLFQILENQIIIKRLEDHIKGRKIGLVGRDYVLEELEQIRKPSESYQHV